jgi:hypothetical protein
MGVEVNNDPPLDTAPTLQDHRRFKDAKDVPPDATIQFLKPSMLGKILVHHRHVLSLPSTFLNEPDDVDGEVKMIAAKAYSIKNFWYVDYEVVAPDAKRLQYQGRIWQVPVMRGAAKSTNHCANVIDMLKQIYDKPSTLADIGITNVRNAKIYKLVAGLATTVTQNDTKRKQLETQVADLRSLERINTTITNIQEQEYTKQKQEKDLKSTEGPIYQHIIDTFPPNSDSIWDETEEELIELAKRELVSTGLCRSGEILKGKVIKIKKSYPVYNRGYKDKLVIVQSFLDTIQGLHPIGRYGSFKYNNQDHSILMGLVAADSVAKNLEVNLWDINTESTYQESASSLSLREIQP